MVGICLDIAGDERILLSLIEKLIILSDISLSIGNNSGQAFEIGGAIFTTDCQDIIAQGHKSVINLGPDRGDDVKLRELVRQFSVFAVNSRELNRSIRAGCPQAVSVNTIGNAGTVLQNAFLCQSNVGVRLFKGGESVIECILNLFGEISIHIGDTVLIACHESLSFVEFRLQTVKFSFESGILLGIHALLLSFFESCLLSGLDINGELFDFVLDVSESALV